MEQGGDKQGTLPISNEFPSVPASKLREHIEKLNEPRGTYPSGFDEEFLILEHKSITNSISEEFASANQEYNRMKNRYANVLPPEKTRVKLSLTGENTSDYINANYIASFRGPKTYISAQGPLKATAEDFWRMIWEENCDTIVMLTKIKENGRYKCHKYWPDQEEQFGPLIVKLLSVNDDEALKERRFKVINTITNDEREIHHFQYVEWPDHGLPTSTAKFRSMLHRVDSVHTAPSPILVHCSAGIGRTGTFCAVHSTLHRLRNQTTTDINLPDLILQLRAERTGMVQTRDQYEFCYQAILEEIENQRESGTLNLYD